MKTLFLFFLLPFLLFSQVQRIDTTNGNVILGTGVKYIRGKIIEVDHTKSPRIYITVLNDSTGTIQKIKTPKYIRGQKEFYIQGDSLNIMPPPLHVTNFWVTENKMYIEASEPVKIVLYNRNHHWKGTYVQWGAQELNHDDGYQMGQAFEFNYKWFTTKTVINITDPTPDDWDFAVELKPIRTGIPYWSDWMHFRTFYFAMYEH